MDSGATNILRKAYNAEEWNGAREVGVTLAGDVKRMMKQARTGSVLTDQEVQPIIPMSMLVEAGCKVTWNNSQCMVRHPTLCRLNISLQSGCPELNPRQAREVTADLE